nr:hypothetical protein [Candidatus Protochlamydia phocaeensis]
MFIKMTLIFIRISWKFIEKQFLKNYITLVKKKRQNKFDRKAQLHFQTAYQPIGKEVFVISKKLFNHIGAIKYFLSHYNLEALYKFLGKKELIPIWIES